MKKVVIVPRYIETIVVYKDKESEEALSHTNYEFDERGECELVMEFYDGIAYDVEGSGLVMTYPKAEKVQAHTILQNCIVAYTGIDDDIIGQFDIALRYGKLEWRKEEVDPEYWQDKLDPEDFDDDPEWEDEPDDDPEWEDDPEEDDKPEGAPDDYIALIKKAADDITKASLQIAAMFSK